MTSAYLTSERAPNMYVGKPEALDRLSYPVMKQKGFEMFDMHDMSAAFSYDTATQYDGMHIIGKDKSRRHRILAFHHCAPSLTTCTNCVFFYRSAYENGHYQIVSFLVPGCSGRQPCVDYDGIHIFEERTAINNPR